MKTNKIKASLIFTLAALATAMTFTVPAKAATSVANIYVEPVRHGKTAWFCGPITQWNFQTRGVSACRWSLKTDVIITARDV